MLTYAIMIVIVLAIACDVFYFAVSNGYISSIGLISYYNTTYFKVFTVLIFCVDDFYSSANFCKLLLFVFFFLLRLCIGFLIFYGLLALFFLLYTAYYYIINDGKMQVLNSQNIFQLFTPGLFVQL